MSETTEFSWLTFLLLCVFGFSLLAAIVMMVLGIMKLVNA